MPILLYSPEVRMAVADDPMFLREEEAATTIAQDGAETLLIQEWRTYFVKFYGDAVPDFFPKPEARLYTQREFPGQLFEVSFRNAVGRTRIGPVCVRVESGKISEALYEAMLSYIADKFANLVFSFASPLGQSYRKETAGKDIAYIEYLFLKKYLLDASPNVDGIAALILANPHHRLYREFRNCSIDAVTHTQPAMLINMFTASDRFALLKKGHPLLATNLGRRIFNKKDKGIYPSEALEERKYHTVDTNENRFVKHFLQMVQRRLDTLPKVLKATPKSYLNPDIEQHLEKMTRKISSFLADPLWNDVGSMVFIPVNSQVLQRREGYRQLFQLYSLMQLASRCDFINTEDFQNLLETKDTPTLFEYWSFFVIKDILDGLLKMKPWSVIVSDNSLEQKVDPGICIKYDGDLSLWFNKTYNGSSGHQPGDSLADNKGSQGSYSHNFRPDIVLAKKDNLLIFDAKYKGQRSGFYGENEDGSIFSWKDEDIDKMHCYREAIRNVSGAYILYPGEKAVIYSCHDAQGLYQGVGALPLKPEAGVRPVQHHLDSIKDIIVDFIKEV